MSNTDLNRLLEKLENLVDPGHVEGVRDLQRRAFAFEPVGHIPTLINYGIPDDEWPSFGFQEINRDLSAMLLSELRGVYLGAKLRDDRLYGIRANYGTGIVASMFGCETVTFDNSLPTALPLPPERRERILEAGMPDLRAGMMGRALETVAYFRETLRPYPKLSRTVGSSLLDIQGPFDNADLIWGSDIYLLLIDDPERFRRLMQIVTDTIAAVVKEHRRIDGGALTEDACAWGPLGGICVRDDSSINLSGAQYAEMVKPFDKQLLKQFHGWIHFCGRAHQWWQELLDIPGLKGINPYQGEFYDLYDMYERCLASKIPLIQWMRPLDKRCRERIRTGLSRITGAADFPSACRTKELLYATGHADE